MIISLVKNVFRNILGVIIKLFESHTPTPTARSQAHFAIVRYGSLHYAKKRYVTEAFTSLSLRKPSFAQAFHRLITYSYKTHRTQANRFHSRLRQFITSVHLPTLCFGRCSLFIFRLLNLKAFARKNAAQSPSVP